jgi:hypothetical protein
MHSHFNTLRAIITKLPFMKNPTIKSFLISFVTICSILGVSFAVIAYGRGYRMDIKKSSLKPTGLVSATSDPVGAQIFVEGILKSATNYSFAVEPGWYTVSISKEGYITWQKKIRIQGEVVTRADAFLFPSNPSLSPLTNLGMDRPVLSPDGSKIAYVIPLAHLDGSLAKKAGLWVYELSEGPLGRNRDPIQVAPYDASLDVTTATITWSPDATKILVDNGITYHLYDVSRSAAFTDVTITAQSLKNDWAEERALKETQKMAAFKQPIIDMATSSAKIISLSPDETKILYEATAAATIPKVINPPLIGTNSTEEQRTIKPNNIYVYDSKEDKNYFLLDKKELPAPKKTTTKKPATTPLPETAIHWFPTSRHLLLTLPGKIDVMEFDRTNWTTIYSGPFVDGFVAPWSNGSRIIIMTNLNGDTTTLPNLYTVNLR